VTTDTNVSRRAWAAPAVAAGVAILAFAVRLPAALHFALWQDEVASGRILISPGLSFLRRVVETESAPPAWYTLAWATHRLGVPVADVRVLSVLFGSMLAALVVLYARSLVSLPASALAGVLAALGWQFVMHGWELRAYALFALASFLFVLAFEAAAEHPTQRRLLLVGVAVAVASLTHYFFVFTLAAALVWLWTSPPVRRTARPVTIACALGLIPLLVWTPAFFAQYHKGRFSWIGPFRGIDVVYLYGHIFSRSLPPGGRGAVIGVGLLVLTLFGAVRLWRSSARGRLCAWVAVGPVVLSALVWAAGPHIFATRNLLGTGPFAAVAVGAAIDALPELLVPVVALAGVAIAVAGYVDSRAGPPDFDRVATALVAEGWSERDPILIFGPPHAYLHPLDWYLPRHDPLAIVRPNPGARCRRAYVVSVGGRGLGLARTSRAPSRRVKSVLVARVPWTDTIWARLRLGNGHAVASERFPPPCTRPS
jgi:hypothetical protein